MKKYRTITSLFVLFLLWQIISIQIDNDFLIPYPIEVIKMMGQQLMSASFYEIVFATLLRSFLGLTIAFVVAFLCAYYAYRYTVFKDIFYPILLLTRSVPNIAYIIIILVWFGAENSAAIVSFLIIFPTIYSNIYTGLENMDENLKKVMSLYPSKEGYCLRKIYIPLLKAPMKASISTGISLTFKVGVMAEILGQVQVGIGRQLNLARITSDITGIFAWTGWIILILLLMEAILHFLYNSSRFKES
ncbi:ABC transporter permease [Amedibacillus sp. YH-ame10]